MGSPRRTKGKKEMTNATWEERKAYFARVNAQIAKILGEKDEENAEKRRAYEKARTELWALVKKYGEEVINGSALLISCGDANGFTPQGKRVVWYGNRGYTIRSRYCGTLVIDGKTIFTSGKISKCFEYIFNN